MPRTLPPRSVTDWIIESTRETTERPPNGNTENIIETTNPSVDITIEEYISVADENLCNNLKHLFDVGENCDTENDAPDAFSTTTQNSGASVPCARIIDTLAYDDAGLPFTDNIIIFLP